MACKLAAKQQVPRSSHRWPTDCHWLLAKQQSDYAHRAARLTLCQVVAAADCSACNGLSSLGAASQSACRRAMRAPCAGSLGRQTGRGVSSAWAPVQAARAARRCVAAATAASAAGGTRRRVAVAADAAGPQRVAAVTYASAGRQRYVAAAAVAAGRSPLVQRPGSPLAVGAERLDLDEVWVPFRWPGQLGGKDVYLSGEARARQPPPQHLTPTARC